MWVHENESVPFSGSQFGWKNYPQTYATGTVHIVNLDTAPKAEVTVTVADGWGPILDLRQSIMLTEHQGASNKSVDPSSEPARDARGSRPGSQ